MLQEQAEDSLTKLEPSPPVALTIAGSDSGGGAGIQADLLTFANHRVFGTSAITAVTAQNTLGVQEINVLPAEFVRTQILSVVSDFTIRATKTGMLGNSQIVRVIASLAEEKLLPNLVIDPVMVATSGDRLLDIEAIELYKSLLLPQALIITPNIAEAGVLLDRAITNIDEMISAALELSSLASTSVILKGGHLVGKESTDIFVRGAEVLLLRTQRIDSANTHGTGCTLSSAIAANLARGLELEPAVRGAKDYVRDAIFASKTWRLGAGDSSISHFTQSDTVPSDTVPSEG